MTQTESFLKGKRILAVDDEKDIIETIEEILDEAIIDVAYDYETASEKINNNSYDIAILDIMGVNGIKLLEQAVKKDIPAVMATMTLVDLDTGYPLAIMDATYITKMRTGAAGGIAAKYLARQNSTTAGFIGAGVQAESQLDALMTTMPNISDIRVYDLDINMKLDFVKKYCAK